MSGSGNISGEREKVLGAVRAALRTPTNHHVIHSRTEPDRESYTAGLPFVEDTWEAKRDTFAVRCEGLRAGFMVVENVEGMYGAVRELVAAEKHERVAYHRHLLVSPVIAMLGIKSVCVDERCGGKLLEECDVGITGCDALVAQTGSVMVSSGAIGGRALSVLPPHHIVLATAEQLVADLPTAYRQVIAARKLRGSSMVSFITGPSRTGDIERILVLGAHGPKKLTIILVAPPRV